MALVVSTVPIQNQVAAMSLAFGAKVAQAHAEGAMNSLVRITRPDGWNSVTFEYDDTQNTVVYDDPDTPGAGAMAGVSLQTGSVQSDYADEPTYTSSTHIYIPQDAPTTPQIDDLVEIIYCPDREAQGQIMRVTDVTVGGRIIASIDLSVTVNPPSKEIVP
jgi:hypothetical protein